jgi:phosphate transport system substrate-binding protein
MADESEEDPSHVNHTTRTIAAGLAVLTLAAACSGGGTAAQAPGSAVAGCVAGSITVAGSTAMQPMAEKARDAYQAKCSGSTINVQGGGSGQGLSQVSQGAVQIGNSDVAAGDKLATPDAQALIDHLALRQGWIMVTHPGVTGVTNLTTDQAKQIWTGAITNWKDVGGPDVPIVLVIRPASSGTRAVFKKIVLGGVDEAAGQGLTEDSNGTVTTTVETTPGATSVIGFSYFNDPAAKGKVNGLQLDGITASVENLQSGSYKLQAFGHMYTKGEPTGLTKAFIDFVLSDAVQKDILPGLSYAPAK